jgi:predicted extracellular nuclease
MRVSVATAIASAVALLAGAVPATANTAGDGLVISQIYGAGGNSGAVLNSDYVELFNPTGSPLSLSGWSIQYTSATGTGNFGATSTQLTELPNVSIGAGQYYLVRESSGANGAALPTPDLTDPTPIAMAAAAGKVALVSQPTTLGCNGSSTPCNASQLALIVDLVGYGTGAGGANFFEGSGAAPTIGTTTADFRNQQGCTDTDNNAGDFTAAAPAPRNSATAPHSCSTISLSINDVSQNEGNAGTTSFTFTVSLSSQAPLGGVTFDIATADGSAIAPGDYASQSLIGQTIPAGSSTYTFTVAVNGDTSTEPDETFTVDVTNVGGFGVVVADTQGLGTILNDDACGLPFTPAYDIQGSGSTAAITGTVTTQGVVVGDFEGSSSTGIEGFYLQDATGDGNTATSDGIFVFTGGANTVTPGELVRVTGYARERFGQTALNGSNSNTSPVTQIADCGTGSVAATDVYLPFHDSDFPERFEGMSVRFPQSLVISEYFNYDRFGELVLALPLAGESRPFTPTSVVAPGAPAQARALANGLSRITLDDGKSSQNPEFLRHPNGSQFLLSNLFRGGDTVTDTVGVLGFDFNLYRVQPTGPATYVAANPRPAAPSSLGPATLRVGSMNTLNFFLTPDYPTGDPLDNKCGPGNNVECRGWDSDQPNEFTRQRSKLLQALAGVNADVLGLNELENSTGVDPLGDPAKGIVPGLNAMPGVGPYAAIGTGVIGTDAIRVGLIYKPSKVTPIGPFKLLTTAVDPRFIDTKNRPSLAQTFEENATGARFTVVVNHLKSKGSDCNDVGDPDTGDGQGNCNLTRTNAAQALVDWIAGDPTGSGDQDFLIVGDLNSYAMEDPISAITAGPDDTAGTSDDYTNLVALFLGPYAYSYVFDGQAGYLDHALADASLAPQVTGAAEWHINADEPDVLDYDTSFKGPAQEALFEQNAYRTSDHDPVLVGLDLRPTYDDLCRLTRRLVTKEGIANGLCSKLATAEAAAAAGDTEERDGALRAYRNQLEAQTGNAVSQADADRLEALSLVVG